MNQIKSTATIVALAVKDDLITHAGKAYTKKLQVLLVNTKDNNWELPNESVDSSLSDSLKSVIGKTFNKEVYTEQLYTYENTEECVNSIDVAYLALSNNTAQNSITSNWFWVETNRNKLKQVESIRLINSTDNTEVIVLNPEHTKMLIDGINRISNKVLYTDIGFHLVDDEFTIRELQLAYEAVLEKELVGFRRVIEPKIVETGKSTLEIKDRPEAHRPSKIYRKKI